MAIQPDFRELLELFNARAVEYLIVGAHALAFHGSPRATGDIDLYVNPTPANARRIVAALAAFGFGDIDLAAADFEQPDRVVQLGVPPVRVDLITSITGVSWDRAEAGKVAATYGDVPVHYLGRDEFIANKTAIGRPKDLADLDALGASGPG